MQMNTAIATSQCDTDDLDADTQTQWLALASRLHLVDPEKFRELLAIATDIVEAQEILKRIVWPGRRTPGVLSA